CLEDRIKIRDCRTKFTDRKLPSKLQQFIRCNREKFVECNGIKFVINQWKGMTEQFEINTRLRYFTHRNGPMLRDKKTDAPDRTVHDRDAYHLTEKSVWGVESIMVSDLPVYRRTSATSVTV
ncbi:unnamed protein product, partial [Porites evermanni]